MCVQIQNEESSTNLAHKQTPSLLKIDEGVFQLSTLAHVSNQGVIDRLVRPSVRPSILKSFHLRDIARFLWFYLLPIGIYVGIYLVCHLQKEITSSKYDV